MGGLLFCKQFYTLRPRRATRASVNGDGTIDIVRAERRSRRTVSGARPQSRRRTPRTVWRCPASARVHDRGIAPSRSEPNSVTATAFRNLVPPALTAGHRFDARKKISSTCVLVAVLSVLSQRGRCALNGNKKGSEPYSEASFGTGSTAMRSARREREEGHPLASRHALSRGFELRSVRATHS